MNDMWPLPLRLWPCSQDDQETDSTLHNRCSHRNNTGHRDLMTSSRGCNDRHPQVGDSGGKMVNV